MNNLPKVVTQQRRGRASNPRLLDRKSDALPLSHRAIGWHFCSVQPARQANTARPQYGAILSRGVPFIFQFLLGHTALSMVGRPSSVFLSISLYTMTVKCGLPISVLTRPNVKQLCYQHKNNKPSHQKVELR